MGALLLRAQRIIRELEEVRQEERQARRILRQAAARSGALRAAPLPEAHRRQLLTMLSVADGAMDVTIACVDHASHPPPWGALCLAEKMNVLRDVVSMHTAAEITAWFDDTIVENHRMLRQLRTVRQDPCPTTGMQGTCTSFSQIHQ